MKLVYFGVKSLQKNQSKTGLVETLQDVKPLNCVLKRSDWLTNSEYPAVFTSFQITCGRSSSV